MDVMIDAGCAQSWQQLAKFVQKDVSVVRALPDAPAEKLLLKAEPGNLSNQFALLPAESSVFILYNRAEFFLASHHDFYQDLPQAVQDWLAQTAEVLSLWKKDRRRVRLVCIDDLIQVGAGKAAVLQPWFTRKGTMGPVPMGIELLLAQQYLQQHSELLERQQLLQASSLPLLSQPALSFDVSALQQAWQQQSQQAGQLASVQQRLAEREQQHSTERDALTAENTLLLEQLMAVQEELERQLHQRQELAAQHQQQQQQLTQQLQQSSSQQAALQQQLQQQKHQLAEAVQLRKQYEWQLGKAQTEIETLQRHLAGASLRGQQAQHELASVKKSTLWKVTSPVRRFSSAGKKKQQQLQRDMVLLRSCALFDTEWYLQHYPDVAESGKDAIEHYLQFGAKEGRVPGPDFDGNWYISHYPDVAKSGMNPLVHYVKFGQAEGRQVSPKLLQLKTANAQE